MNVAFEALEPAYGIVIPRFSLPPCQFRYESRRLEEKYTEFGEKIPPMAWGFYASFAQVSAESSDVVNTPEFLIIYSRPLSPSLDFGIQADGFYGSYKSAYQDRKASLIPLGGRGGISLVNRRLTLGIDLDYHYPMFK